MVAQITQQPIFDIGIERATMIAKPLQDVQRYYPIKTDGPVLSLVKLGAGVLAVNLPILMVLGAQNAQKKAQRAKPAAQPATPEVIIPGSVEVRKPMDFSGAA